MLEDWGGGTSNQSRNRSEQHPWPLKAGRTHGRTVDTSRPRDRLTVVASRLSSAVQVSDLADQYGSACRSSPFRVTVWSHVLEPLTGRRSTAKNRRCVPHPVDRQLRTSQHGEHDTVAGPGRWRCGVGAKQMAAAAELKGGLRSPSEAVAVALSTCFRCHPSSEASRETALSR